MELWIRSQNRKVLVKIHSISIEVKTSTKFSIVGNDEWKLGIYETEERALEVLNEIQKILQPQIVLKKGKITGCVDDTIFREPDGYEVKELSTYVYEMPKE